MNKLLITMLLLFGAAFLFGRLDDEVSLLASDITIGAIFFFPLEWLSRRTEDEADHASFKPIEQGMRAVVE